MKPWNNVKKVPKIAKYNNNSLNPYYFSIHLPAS